MKKTTYYYIIVSSLLLGILYFIYSPFRFTPHEYSFSIGEISDREIIAPYDFDIYKNVESLRSEQEIAALNVRPVYKLSETLTFNAIKNLDFLFKPFILSVNNNFIEIKNKLHRNGFNLADTTIIYLNNDKYRNQIYGFLSTELVNIFNVGIYPEDFPYLKIKLIREKKEVEEYSLARLFSLTEAKEKILSKEKDLDSKKILEDILNIVLIINIIEDSETLRILQQEVKDNISLFKGKVLKNEKIINKNQKVTVDIIQKLNSLNRSQQSKDSTIDISEIIQSSFGISLFAFILLFIFHYIISICFSDFFSLQLHYIIVYFALFLPILSTILTNNLIEFSSLVIPYSLSIIIIAFIFNAEIGILFNFVLMLFISIFLNLTLTTPIIHFVISCSALIAIKRLKYEQEYFVITLYLLIGLVSINIAFSLFKLDDITVFFLHIFYSVISIGISIVITMLLLPILHKKLNIATKQILLELLDFENSLLRRLQKQAPGTYHHSLIVGNLAESAAEAIGADYLLARVGSYYHDIGKLENPTFFTENNADSSQLHDRLMANESALIIRNHIKDGVTLAKKEKLPQTVIDILEQHHGTSQIRFFYNKALETKLIIDDEIFYYAGPKPQTKEAAIVTIADIVESTSKSLKKISNDILKKILDDTIFRLLKEGQLDEAPISMKELEEIKKYMLPILLGIYGKRIEYPDTDVN
ncbi:MAG: HDIG domain-containing protein [Candidatus Cloacimonetes bacterium]|nr:HDIG domain-containing protein [Candidatus Cloacimonadota bacterium]